MSILIHRICGLCVIGFGPIIILYVYAFARMVDPELTTWERATEIAGKMLLGPEVVGVAVGLAWIAYGLHLMVSPQSRLLKWGESHVDD